MVCRIAILLGLLLMPLLAQSAASDSRYNRTVRALQQGPMAWRLDFAYLALQELAASYQAEAELARTDQTAEAAKKLRWSREVERYANRLLFLQSSLDIAESVSLTLTPFTDVIIEVGGQQEVLTHPRPEQQAAYEQSVLAAFCQLRDCAQLAPELAEATDVDSESSANNDGSQSDIRASWLFTADGPACAYRGLHIDFPLGTDTRKLRQHCSAFFADAIAILEGMREQRQYGVHIQWRELAVSTLAAEQGHMLKLNTAGDTVLLELQIITEQTELLGVLQPWLIAALQGRSSHLNLQSEQLGW